MELVPVSEARLRVEYTCYQMMENVQAFICIWTVRGVPPPLFAYRGDTGISKQDDILVPNHF